MKWRYFKLFIDVLLVAGLLASIVIEDKLMAIFFVLAMILSELENIHDTIKRTNQWTAATLPYTLTAYSMT